MRGETAAVSRAALPEKFEIAAPEFAWRVLRLINVFRTLAAVFLLAMFLLAEEPRLIGNTHPELFFVTALAYFVFGALNDFAVTQRWPSLLGQSVGQATADIVALVLMAHASGGLESGLGNLLVVSIGAISLIWPRRRAVMFGAMAAIAVLAEQYFMILAGDATLADSTPAGVLGGILLFVSFAAHPLARRIGESEALARQRGIDLENLAQLNDYIIQNLRESIVVVDGDDRIRLMNEAAAKLLASDRDPRGRPLADVSPRSRKGTTMASDANRRSSMLSARMSARTRLLSARFLLEQLAQKQVKVTRLAFGLPAGSGIGYSDPVTLARAMEGRQGRWAETSATSCRAAIPTVSSSCSGTWRAKALPPGCSPRTCTPPSAA